MAFQCRPISLLDMQVQDGKQAQYDAFYRLSNTEQQITSYVFDVSLVAFAYVHHTGISQNKLPALVSGSGHIFQMKPLTTVRMMMQVVRAIVPKIILDDVFTVSALSCPWLTCPWLICCAYRLDVVLSGLVWNQL